MDLVNIDTGPPRPLSMPGRQPPLTLLGGDHCVVGACSGSVSCGEQKLQGSLIVLPSHLNNGEVELVEMCARFLAY